MRMHHGSERVLVDTAQKIDYFNSLDSQNLGNGPPELK